MTKAEIPTPALLVDLDQMEANLERMAAFFRSVPAKLRPHFKNHKSAALAKRQLAAGAIGITCATVYEAECLVEQGVSNILLANEVAEPAKIRRLAALAGHADLIVAIDDPQVCQEFARAAHDAQVTFNALVDVDVGMHRCGVQPGEPALRLVQQVREAGLRFRGLMGYAGQVEHMPPGAEKQQAVAAALGPLIETKTCLEGRGIAVDIVSVGGTGSHALSGSYPGVTEVQAGSYLLMDTRYRECCTDFHQALTVLATVVSNTGQGRVVADAGRKAITCELGLPTLKDAAGLTVANLHAEHALIDVRDSATPPQVGDKLEFWVRYSDGNVNLHAKMFGLRNGQVEEVFPVCGGGRW